MRSKITVTIAVLLSLAFAGPRPAQAQFAVIDVGAIAQLIQEVSTLEQDLAHDPLDPSVAPAGSSVVSGTRRRHTTVPPPRGGVRRRRGTDRQRGLPSLPPRWSRVS